MRRFLALFLVGILLLAGLALPAAAEEDVAEWAIYWYLCGSDLESERAAASKDLEEMMQAPLPPGVKVVIQTGGAKQWHMEGIDANSTMRLLYDENGMQALQQGPVMNMGEASTLADFLLYCTKNHPARKEMVLFWDHGGGPLGGFAYDENFLDENGQPDCLRLKEMEDAMNAAVGLQPDAPWFDLVGFDACLMATIDSAQSLLGFSAYMLASEESEPGNGWDYTALMNALARDPGMDAKQLGISICNSYAAHCQQKGTDKEITLSLVDVRKVPALSVAFDEYGKEALLQASQDPTFFSSFARSASATEKYGGGNYNMVDLGDLAKKSQELFPQSTQPLRDALEECVVYKVNSGYRAEASGLACYYQLIRHPAVLEAYAECSWNPPIVYLFEYELFGEMSPNGQAYLSQELGVDSLAPMPAVEYQQQQGFEALESFPVELDQEYNAILNLGPDLAQAVMDVRFQLAMVLEGQGLVLLGTDNDVFTDWETGVFTENFFNDWGMLDGHLATLHLTDSTEDYNLYSVPILLEGQPRILRVAYDKEQDRYLMLGTQAEESIYTASAKDLQPLGVGDEVAMRYRLLGENEVQEVTSQPFLLTEDSAFTFENMGDGQRVLMFELLGLQGQSVTSQPVLMTVEGDDITMEVGGE